MKVLVTGGQGRLGKALIAANKNVVGLPRATLDVTKPQDIDLELETGGYSVVLNTAGVTALEAAEASPDLARAANAIGPGLLAAACARRGVPLIHISTDYVFGAATACPWRESDPVSPVNTYGRTKAEGEARVLAAGPTGHVVRVAWLFGDSKDFITSMLRRGRFGPVTVADDQVGSPTPLGPLSVHLLSLCQRLSEGEKSLPPILHLAGSPPVSRADWVASAFALLRENGVEPPLLRRAPMASFQSGVARPNFSALDCALAHTLFGGPLDWATSLTESVRGGHYQTWL